MLYVLDSSALVKRYHREPGTPTILELFEEAPTTLIICSLSLPETVSALHRHCRRGTITEADFEVARFRLGLDISLGQVGVVDMQRRHIVQASELIVTHHLTGADAVILACTLDLAPYGPVFVCADTNSGLLHAAQACGLSTLNPLTPPA